MQMSPPIPSSGATTQGNEDREGSDKLSLLVLQEEKMIAVTKGIEPLKPIDAGAEPSHDEGDLIATTNSTNIPQKEQQQILDTKSRSRKRTDRNHKPTPEDALLKLLRTRNLYEPVPRTVLRRTVLAELEAFLQSWVDRITPPTTYTRQIVHVCTFGSYRLGVHNASSDIDVLCLTPAYVTRNDFFTSLVQMLEQHHEAITELQPVSAAFTPVIKMKWKGIPIDLVFAHFADTSPSSGSAASAMLDGSEEAFTPAEHTHDDEEEPKVPVLQRRDTSSSVNRDSQSEQAPKKNKQSEFQIQDQHLIGLDEPSIRSLNGVRVAQMLLDLIPPGKMQDFRIVLRIVKEWATVHGLYSNVLGFLGGVNWAIMVVKIIQLFPTASTTELMHRFFTTFSRWRWPKPVRIAPTHYAPPPGVAPQIVWNPKVYPRDRTHLMPIITPAYPNMNSTYNVGLPQLRRIRDELDRAATIVGQVLGADKDHECVEGTANNHVNALSWDELMEESDFFRRHGHYLQINIIAANAKDFRSWFGLCESRLRLLIASLESPEKGVQAYPFARFFFRNVSAISESHGKENAITETCLGVVDNSADSLELEAHEQRRMYVSSFFIALRFAPDIESIDLTSCAHEFLFKVNSWEDRREGMDMTIEHLLWTQLPGFVFADRTQDRAGNAKSSGSDGKAKRAGDNDSVNLGGSGPHQTGSGPGKRRNTNVQSNIGTENSRNKSPQTLSLIPRQQKFKKSCEGSVQRPIDVVHQKHHLSRQRVRNTC